MPEEFRAEDKLLNYYRCEPTGGFRTLVAFHVAIAHVISRMGKDQSEDFLKNLEERLRAIRTPGQTVLQDAEKTLLNLLRVELKDDVSKARGEDPYQ